MHFVCKFLKMTTPYRVQIYPIKRHHENAKFLLPHVIINKWLLRSFHCTGCYTGGRLQDDEQTEF